MCFHSEDEYKEYQRQAAAYARAKARAAGERARLIAAVVIMRDPRTGKFEEAYKCKADDKQDIANCIRNLRAWHPGDKVVDLTIVNDMRRKLRLTEVMEDALPAPTGRVPKSEDDYRNDAAVPAVLLAVRFTAIPAPTVAELAAEYDELQRIDGTKMAIEWALKHGFTPPRGEVAREEEKQRARVPVEIFT